MPALTFDDLAPAAQSQGSRAITFDDLKPEASPVKDAAVDVAKAVPAGLARGAAAVVGLPGFLSDLVDKGYRNAPALWGGETISPERAAQIHAARGFPAIGPGAVLTVLTPKNVQGAIEGVTGPLYEPQTTAGKFAGTAAEFIPGALLGPGGMAKNALTYGVIPGIASEAAGQATHGTALEPWARGAAAIGTGGVGAFVTRPNNAGAMISRAAEGMTPQQVEATERLFQEAQQVGVPITRAEAAQAVTNGATGLADLQRVVEGNGGLKPFMAQRPGQVSVAGDEMLTRLGGYTDRPSVIGPRVGEAAEDIVRGAQADINARTRPLYQAAEQERVGAPVANALAGDPLYAQTLQEIRNNPALNRTIENLPNDSPAVIDLVQRRLREQADNARVPGQAHTSNLMAANLEDARAAPMAAADTATGSQAATATQPRTIGTYEAARMAQQKLRDTELAPLVNGPIGKLAQRDLPTQQAMDALFPRNPLPNSAREITDAVTRLAAQRPGVAGQLVRAHIESIFNQTTRNLQAGPSQFGGASFAAAIRGNTQQAANLSAAIQALHGPEALNGFDRFLRVMEATGQRQRIGSQTAFNTEFNKIMGQGGSIQSAMADAASLFTHTPRRFRETLEQYNMGQNTDQIARILTDPEGAAAFRRLALAPEGSAKAAALMSRLLALGSQSSRNRRDQQ
ncbi:MAG: hypothetical protein JSS66_18955 [Armatimonadetes bacterium]|nr:hypothetical protein [Armatimonadota bacterium]